MTRTLPNASYGRFCLFLSTLVVLICVVDESYSLSVNQRSLTATNSEKQQYQCPETCPIEDCEWGWTEYYCDYDNDDDDLAVGWIVAIAIVGLILLVGLPVLVCFFCACCCFKTLRSKKSGPPQVIYVQGPPPNAHGTSQPTATAPQAFQMHQWPRENNDYSDNQGFYAEPPPQYPHHPPLPSVPPPETQQGAGKF